MPDTTPESIDPLLASQIAVEYSALRAPNGCPVGMYLLPTPESLLRWAGVFFVHDGPYAGAVLRFALIFPTSFPRNRPQVIFESEIFHPMVDPKTHEWTPRGRLTQWQPHADHVVNLLHSLHGSFSTASLDTVTEEQATNRQVWSMYTHSRETFLALTTRRARGSSSPQTLYDHSQSDGEKKKVIRFTELDEPAVGRLWADLRRSLGES